MAQAPLVFPTQQLQVPQLLIPSPPTYSLPPQPKPSNNTGILIFLLLLLIFGGGGYYWYTNYYMNTANMSEKRFRILYKKCVLMAMEKREPKAAKREPPPMFLNMMATAAQKALKQLGWNLKPNELCKLLMEEDTTPRGKEFTAAVKQNAMPGCTIM